MKEGKEREENKGRMGLEREEGKRKGQKTGTQKGDAADLQLTRCLGYQARSLNWHQNDILKTTRIQLKEKREYSYEKLTEYSEIEKYSNTN